MMRIALALSVIACGPTYRDNTLISTVKVYDEVRAPHTMITMIDGAGLSTIYLDTRQRQLLDEDAGAHVLFGLATVRTVKDKLVIRRGGRDLEVAGVVPNPLHISPDGRWFVVAEEITLRKPEPGAPAYRLQIVNALDSSVRTLELPTEGTAPYPAPQIAWTATSDAILVEHFGYSRIVPSTGDRKPIAKLDWQNERLDPELVECRPKGLRLETRHHDKRQELVVVPVARTADPDMLETTRERIVVSATDHPGSSSNERTVLDKQPQWISSALFTPTCSHLVFELEGMIYVTNLETGAIGRLDRGTKPRLPP